MDPVRTRISTGVGTFRPQPIPLQRTYLYVIAFGDWHTGRVARQDVERKTIGEDGHRQTYIRCSIACLQPTPALCLILRFDRGRVLMADAA
jgi:hypothetical protein